MASTSTPYGFQPVSHNSGTPRTVRMSGGIASGYGSNIFKFQPIKLVAGLIQPVTATTDQILGVFAGVEFTPSGGRPAVSPYWPSGSTYQSTGGYPLFDMNVYFWPAWDPVLRFQVQADGSVAQALMGSQFNVSNVGNGSTTTGLSAATVANAGVVASSQGQFFLEEFAGNVGDPFSYGGDAFTDLIVGIAYQQIGAGYQTSIG
jgi:hypothetical protein